MLIGGVLLVIEPLPKGCLANIFYRGKKMEWLAIGIAAFVVTAYTMVLFFVGHRKESE
jgi:hypothetical protein